MNKIEKSRYQGYLWYSDETVPSTVLFDEEFELELDTPTNGKPFVVEGMLYDGCKSFSIKFVDGKHLIIPYDMAELETVDYTEHNYLANTRIGKNLWLRFRQYWRPDEDELCENMKVNKPAEMVFVGFEIKKEN